MKTWFPVVIKTLFFAVIPAVLIWLSRPEYYGQLMKYFPFSYFAAYPFVQFLLFLTGTVLGALLCPVLIAISDSALARTKEQRDALVGLSARTFLSVLQVLTNNHDMKMDIYIPDKGKGFWSKLGWSLCDAAEQVTFGWFKPERHFIATDLSYNAGLRFQVSPNPEGPVGRAYATCLPVTLEADEKLAQKPDKTRPEAKSPADVARDETVAGLPADKVYYVTSEQYNKAADWSLWICAPSCTGERVDLIVSLYGPTAIATEECKKDVLKRLLLFGDDLSRNTIRDKVRRSI